MSHVRFYLSYLKGTDIKHISLVRKKMRGIIYLRHCKEAVRQECSGDLRKAWYKTYWIFFLPHIYGFWGVTGYWNYQICGKGIITLVWCFYRAKFRRTEFTAWVYNLLLQDTGLTKREYYRQRPQLSFAS